MIDELKALRVEVAGLTRERDEARATTEKWLRVVEQLRENLNATLLERDDLRAALKKYRVCRHACVDCFCVKEARAALASGGDRG